MSATQHKGVKKTQKNKAAYYRFLLLCCTLSFGMSAIAQTATGQSAIVKSMKGYRSQTLQEKLFLHLDRPFYVAGETMWFKVYNVDGTLHQPLHLSKVAYVEVLDDNQKPVLQGKVALKDGTGKGSFVLPLSIGSGNFTVRAYTSWMKNFSPEFYFQQPVTILNTYQKLGLEPAAKAAYNLQFFPEGGNLVSGLQGKVAFKITDKATGKGVDATGEILNKAGNVVASFQPSHFGIGNFTFTPASNEEYTAVIKVAGKQVLTQKLPQVFENGYILKLEDLDNTKVKLSVSTNLQKAEQVYLLGHARQVISVAAAALVDGGETSFIVAKDSLGEGITHFTLFNSQNKPVCERLYFKRPIKKLAIEASAAKDSYSNREKVEVDVLTKSTTGSYIPANLSMAVYRVDEAQASTATDIGTYLWLTSELKGSIENPASYLTDTTAQVTEATDNLMLTHGWSRFRWEEVLANKAFAPAFLPEYNGHLVRGKLTHAVSGFPAPDIKAFLAAPSKHIKLYNAVSGADGSIQFEVKDFFGQKEIVVQTDIRTDTTYRFEVFSPFSDKYAQHKLPAFDLDEALNAPLTLRHTEAEAQQQYFQKFRDRFKPAGVDSISFFGKPDKMYSLDDYTRFKVMEEVMREYVPEVLVRKRKGRFHFMVSNSPAKLYFQNDPMVLLDGVPVFNLDKLMAFDPLKVKRMDIITNRFYHGTSQYDGIVSYSTYKGDLAGFPLDPRSLLMEYEGLQLEREFYAPAYDSEEQKLSRLPDFRNLLYWAPELKTKADGKAKASFYTSDSAGTYLVVVQGITKDGLFGSRAFTFEIKQPL